ncbi:MAG: CocE/NonD family hydrolase [Bacteroidia bacterium]|nr:CocE/NonD family hydrolase [Bacteroidia bacterium]
MKKFLLLSSAFLILNSFAFAQLNPQVDSIPMSDGKKLAADVYIPAGCTSCPTILIQTPYNRSLYHFSLPLDIGLNLNSSNYIFVIVDWRCFYGSTAACVATPDRGQDGYEVIQWITSQPWSDGKVGTWGPSALGVIQFQTAKKHPPGLICSVPIVASPVTSYFDYYPGGDLRTEYVQQLAALGYNMTTVLAFPYYNVGWQISETNTDYPDSIAVPMLMIGGWYDHNTDAVLKFFKEIRLQSPVGVRDKHRLLMGPWTHSAAANSPAAVGGLSYPQAQNWSDSLSLKFFDFYLRNINNGWSTTPYVNYFQMGEDVWQSDTAWNSAATTYKLYMHSNVVLDNNAPTLTNDNIGMVYDPRDPSPTVGGPTLKATLQQGPYDQVPLVESRVDIVKFTTTVLSQNVRVHGKPKAYLHVSSDKKDTDFAVRLTDVYPDGRSMLVADGIFRMRFRNGFTTNDTASMINGQIYPIVIDMPNTAITFSAGHRIRVDISSSNYPRFDCNLNNGLQMYVAGDTSVAGQTIYFDNSHESYLSLPVADSTTDISEMLIDEKNNLIVYPNPGTDFIYILSKNISLLKMELYDMTGKRILTLNNIQPLTTLDVRDFFSGIYFLKTYSSGEVSIHKIVILKK